VRDRSELQDRKKATLTPRVIIIGGGFGGLYAARGLAGAPVSVTLLDKRNYHLFRPMLYQVATGLLSGDEIAGPLRSILSRQSNVEVLLEEVTGIDAQNRLVRLNSNELPYDFLIIATGIQYNYFGHDDWQKFAQSLESLEDADAIRGKVLLAFASEQKQEHILNRKSFAHYTNKTITSPNLLRKELIKVRQRGYAIDDEEEELEARCVAAPVFNQLGEFIAGLAIAGTVSQIRDENIDELVRYVTQAANRILRHPEEPAGTGTAGA